MSVLFYSTTEQLCKMNIVEPFYVWNIEEEKLSLNDLMVLGWVLKLNWPKQTNKRKAYRFI